MILKPVLNERLIVFQTPLSLLYSMIDNNLIQRNTEYISLEISTKLSHSLLVFKQEYSGL